MDYPVRKHDLLPSRVLRCDEPAARAGRSADVSRGPDFCSAAAGSARPGYTVRLLEVATTYLESRRVTLSLVMAAGQPAEQAKGYAADVLALVQALNADEGAGIAVLRFDAFDAAGAPLIRERWDLDLGRHSSA
jgi:hypothetical protein